MANNEIFLESREGFDARTHLESREGFDARTHLESREGFDARRYLESREGCDVGTHGGRSACHGWILYTRTESVRNRPYIDLYRDACRKYGMTIELGVCQGDGSWDLRQLALLVEKEHPAFVVNRTRDSRLAEALERLGVCVYNHSGVAALGNDKAKACRHMQQRGIAMMPTVYGIQEPPWYPFVVKARKGHGGTEVYLIRDRKAWQDWQASPAYRHGQARPGSDYIMQQAASDLGRDLRVYVVGNQIAAAVLRTSKEDFRSNYCLGGKAQLYDLSGKERELARRAASGLQIGMAGIDFIFHKGEPVFNEIEDVAGARALYALSDYNIVDAYVSHIKEDCHTK